MIATTPNGHKIRVVESKFLCGSYAGYFFGFFIAVKDLKDEKIILHESIHYEQMKKVGFFSFIRILFDMDYLVKNEIEAYKSDGRFDTWTIARIISSRYSVNFLGKLFGYRTKRYAINEVLEVLNK